MENKFSITIKNGEKEFSISGDAAFVEKWYSKLVKSEVDISNKDFSSITLSNKRQSLPELLRESNANSGSEMIMLFVYFMEKIEGAISVNTSDIGTAFTKAKKASPKNITNQVNQLIAQGLLFEEPEKKNNLKAVTLTDTGLNHVQLKLLNKK